MIKIEKQFNIEKYTILCLNQPVPSNMGKTIRIDDKEYKTEIVYDMPNSIGVIGEGDFVEKEIML